MDNRNIPSITLNNGLKFPSFGLGTWKSQKGEVGNAVKIALELGYRHFDCAAIYGNEVEIGKVFAEFFQKGFKRENLFITSKLWNTCHSPEHVEGSLRKTLKDLQLDYLDLYLIHWPVAFEFTNYDLSPGSPQDDEGKLKFAKVSIRDTWKAMESLVDSHLTKSIGVSNFSNGEILDLLTYARIPPAVNQVEVHPYLVQENLISTCKRFNITITGYTPLGNGKPLEDPIILDIAKKHKKTASQVILRWGIQRGISVIPKSVNPRRLEENINIFDFELSEEEIQSVSKLEKRMRTVLTKPFWGWEFWSV